MGFSRQEYWSGLPFPSPGDLPDPGIEPWSPTLLAGALLSEPPGKFTVSRCLVCCWRNNSRENGETEPKQKQRPAVDVTGDGS